MHGIVRGLPSEVKELKLITWSFHSTTYLPPVPSLNTDHQQGAALTDKLYILYISYIIYIIYTLYIYKHS